MNTADVDTLIAKFDATQAALRTFRHERDAAHVAKFGAFDKPAVYCDRQTDELVTVRIERVSK